MSGRGRSAVAKLGAQSEARLATCAEPLQRLVRAVVDRLPPGYDLQVVEGHRGAAAQAAAYAAGRSSKQWPDSLHNLLPSRAVDLAPYPVDWADSERFVWLAGFVRAVAVELGLGACVRWGGDWDDDSRTTDEKFRDRPHFELRVGC